MRAVVFEGEGKVGVAEVADPKVDEPGDAVVRVTRSGICGSDLHFYHLKAPISPGEIMGHEAVGVVESVGEAVRGFRPGDRVVVAFHIACGECWFCRRGQTALCEDFRNLGAGAFSGGLAGTQAELVLVPDADVNLLKVPDHVDDDRAIFVGDVLTTGYYAAALADVRPGETAAVVGVGPVGFCAVQSLKALGADTVVALDRAADRLTLAASAGAVTVNIEERNAEMALASMTDDRGADVVIEAVGSLLAYESAMDVVRRGGRVVVVGMYTGEVAEVSLGVHWARALEIHFTGVCPVHAWWGKVREEGGAGRLDPTPLVSHHLPLVEAARAYELFDRQEATKVLLVP